MPACWNEFDIIAAYCRLIGLLVGARSVIENSDWLLDAAATGRTGTVLETKMKTIDASITPAAISLTAWRRKFFSIPRPSWHIYPYSSVEKASQTPAIRRISLRDGTRRNGPFPVLSGAAPATCRYRSRTGTEGGICSLKAGSQGWGHLREE